MHETAVLYSNRSMAQSKLEAYGAAVTDADLAIELDPSYVKAYYRRAAGNFALQKYKLSVKDFRHVCKLMPKDKVARVRLAEADKAAKAKAFADAIESEQTAPFGEMAETILHIVVFSDALFRAPNFLGLFVCCDNSTARNAHLIFVALLECLSSRPSVD